MGGVQDPDPWTRGRWSVSAWENHEAFPARPPGSPEHSRGRLARGENPHPLRENQGPDDVPPCESVRDRPAGIDGGERRSIEGAEQSGGFPVHSDVIFARNRIYPPGLDRDDIHKETS